MTKKQAFLIVDEFHAHDEVLRNAMHDIQNELADQDRAAVVGPLDASVGQGTDTK